MHAHGGKRKNAGRPKTAESTKPMRIPLSRLQDVQAFLKNPVTSQVPLYGATVRAGFPSPADDYIEAYLDLNEHLIQHPSATFFVRASGDSMSGAAIHSGDLLVVDRALEAVDGSIVIAAIDGELTVKRLCKKSDQTMLLPENPNYAPIMLTNEQEIVIWGVVAFVIHKAK